MKKIITFVFVLFIGLAVLAGSMAKSGMARASALESGYLDVGPLKVYLPMLVVQNNAAPINQPVDWCMRPLVKNLVTSDGGVVGGVRMHHDSEFLYVEVTAAGGQCLKGIQLQVATDLAGIPQVDGVPVPAQFENIVTFSECATSYTFALPMKPEWKKSSSLVVAIHVDTNEQQTGSQLSAWGDCVAFPGDAGAKYCTYQKPLTKVIPYNVSVGYEDLKFDSPYMDFDYNDWVTDIATDLRYCRSSSETFLWQITLNVTPQARGAALDHAYHIDFPANIFPSNGTATLTKYDQNGNVIGVPLVQPFIANQINQFSMVDPTSNALPGSIVNTVETKPHRETLGTATLLIEFDNAFFFDVSPYLPTVVGNAHGEKLFFQPHLSIPPSGAPLPPGGAYEVGPQTEFKELMLVVPYLEWKWPEERVNIWRAYPDVIPGNTSTNPRVPPQFPENWYASFNNCVYDGVPCTVPAPAAAADAPTLEPYPAP